MRHFSKLAAISFSSDRCGVYVERLENRVLLSTVIVNSVLDTLFSPDSGSVSLRNAVAIANASSDATTIRFDTAVFASKQTITLGGTPLILTNTKSFIDIVGPNAGLTVSGNDTSQVFRVHSNTNARIQGLTIIRGYSFNGLGGGVYNAGKLTLDRVTIASCTALSGGGVFTGFVTSTLSISNSTLIDNRAGEGAGLCNLQNGTASIVNCTFTRNTVGGLDMWLAQDGNGGAVRNFGNLDVRNSTIVGNTAIGGGGGGISSNPVFTLANSIVAQNVDELGVPNVFSQVLSLGYNFIGTSTSTLIWAATDLVGSPAQPLDPRLSPLANHGGATLTMMPLPDSPVLDRGSISLLPAGLFTDQRGYKRIINGLLDIGAVERQANVIQPATATVSGTLFNDRNANHLRDAIEPVLVASTVYADKNNNGSFDVGEPTAVTNSAGEYTLTLTAGQYQLRKLLRSGFQTTLPITGFYDLVLEPGDILIGKDFGHALIA